MAVYSSYCCTAGKISYLLKWCRLGAFPSLHPLLSFRLPPLYVFTHLPFTPTGDPWPLVSTYCLTRWHLYARSLNHPLLNLSSWFDPRLLKALHFLSSNQLTLSSASPRLSIRGGRLIFYSGNEIPTNETLIFSSFYLTVLYR